MKLDTEPSPTANFRLTTPDDAGSVEPTTVTYIVRWVTVVAVAASLVVIGMYLGRIGFDEDQPAGAGVSSLTESAPGAISRTGDRNRASRNRASPPASAPAEPDGSIAADEADAAGTDAAPAPVGASRLVAQQPDRVLDTRESSPLSTDEQRTITIGTGPSAVALSVSVMGSTGDGTVWIDGGTGPVEAVVTGGPGITTTNLVPVPVDSDQLTVESSTGGHLVIDVVGAFEPVGRSAGGRFVGGEPTEITELITESDGRETDLPFGEAVGPGGASAVLVAITADVGADGGMVRLGPDAGQFDQMLMWGPANDQSRTRRGLALVDPGDDLSGYLRYDGGSVLRAEVLGYFTDETAEPSSDGLYLPLGPEVLFDGPLRPAEPVVVSGIEPSARSALVTVSSTSTEPGALGSFLLTSDNGSVTLQAAADLEANVTLLGVFIGS